MNNNLDTFGDFIIKNLWDSSIDRLDSLLEGKMKTPALQELQASLAGMNEEQKSLLRIAFIKSLELGIHDFLFALQEEADNNGEVHVTVNGENVAKLSDGLQGELFSEDGWFSKYSAHGEPGL